MAAANASHGAYFSQSWGWVALAFLMPLALALILGWAAMPGPLRLVFAALVSAVGLWITASALWSLSVPASVRESERVLVYVALAGAVAFVLRRRDADAVASGIFAGVAAIAAYALTTRLVPDWLDTYDADFPYYRLSHPIGYWNALGLFTVVGLLLGVGFVAHARRVPYAAASGATLPVLATTLYFTFSRGAWIALALGAATLVLIDPRRVRLLWCALVVAPPSVLSVAIASQQAALTQEGGTRAAAIDQGHRVAAFLGALVVASSVLVVIARLVAGRIHVGAPGRRAVDLALAGTAVAGAVGVIAWNGGPLDSARELRNRFERDPVATSDLNDRLFQISGNGRQQSLRVAWDAAVERPVVGQGAGSFEYLWYAERPTELVIRDAHSLYAETFAELGLVGLGLMIAALFIPLVAATRARRVRVVPAATAAYITWAAASALDWHWEMVGLTVVALLAGGVALLAQDRRPMRRLPGTLRWSVFVPAVLLTLFAVVSLVGNQALFAGREALARGEWARAIQHGQRADDILRWSAEPELVIGDASARAGDVEEALEQYREAIRADERRWVFWLRVAQGTTGRERRAALRRLRELNPRGRFDLTVRR